MALGTGCQAPLDPLRVGTNVWLGYEPLHRARARGELPARVQLIEFPSSSEVIKSLRNGAIDCAGLTLDEALYVAQFDEDLFVLLVLDVSNGADVLLGGPAVRSLAELRGRRVGVETTALGAFFLSRALSKAGLAPGEVSVVPLEVHEHEGSFSAGKVDALITFEPVRSRLLQGGATVLFDSRETPGEIVDVLVVRRRYLTRNDGRNIPLARDLVAAWHSALLLIQAQPEAAAREMAPRLGLEPGQVLTAMGLLAFGTATQNELLLGGAKPPLAQTAQRLMALMLEQRLLTRSSALEPLFDPALRARVLP